MDEMTEFRDHNLEVVDSAISGALRELPELYPKVDAWPEIENGVIRSRYRRRWRVAFSVAALIVLGVVAGSMLRNGPQVVADAGGVVPDRDLVELMEASRRLELVLQAPEVRERVLGGRRALVILDLEDRIAAVDHALAKSSIEQSVNLERDLSLWAGRVELLDAIVRVRGTDSQVHGVMYAINNDTGRQYE